MPIPRLVGMSTVIYLPAGPVFETVSPGGRKGTHRTIPTWGVGGFLLAGCEHVTLAGKFVGREHAHLGR